MHTEKIPESVVGYILATQRRRHLELFGLVVAGIVLGLVPVHLLRLFIDEVIPRRQTGRLVGLAVVLVASALVRVLVEYRRTLVGEGLRQAVITRLRSELHDHILHLPPSFFAAHPVGDLMNRVQNETGRLGMSVGWIFLDPLVEGTTALLVGAYLLHLDPRLFALALALSPVALVVAPRVNARLSTASRDFTARMSGYGTRLQESLSNAGEVQIHGTWGLETARVDHAQARVVEAWMRVTGLTATLSAVSDLTRGVGPVLVYAVGGYLAVRSGMPVGRIVAFGGLLGGLYGALDKLLKYPPQLRVAEDRYAELRALLVLPRGFRDGAPGDRVDTGSAGVSLELDGVTFGHEPGQPVVDGLSLRVEAGEHVVLVGPSGCGKSTVLGILAGRLGPSLGVVRVGGVELARLPLEERTALLGVVSQHAVIFSGTLRENLLYALLQRPADPSRPLDWLDPARTPAAVDDPGLLALCAEVGLADDLIDFGLQTVAPAEFEPRFAPVRARFQTASRPWDPARSLRDNLLPDGWDAGDAAEDAAVLHELRAALVGLDLCDPVRALSLDRDVGERGARLSGGQRQKVALGRVLLKRPAALLLDEVTASLDEASGRRVVELVRERFAGRTVVAVTHHLAATRHFDRVLVIDRGQVVEEGDTDALRARGGVFARLWGETTQTEALGAGGV